MRAASRNPTEHRESQPRSSDEALGLQRLVFFSDAVTAIAITLLAIDLRVPEIAASAAAAELPRSLSQLGPRFLSFVVSFAVIGTYWMAHHRYFRYIRRHDGKLMLLNMVFLFCIVLMPFVAGLFGQYYYLPLGMSVYAAAVAAIGLSVGGLWWYASWGIAWWTKTSTSGSSEPGASTRPFLRSSSSPSPSHLPARS
jgi:uncharacterized membrane protein